MSRLRSLSVVVALLLVLAAVTACANDDAPNPSTEPSSDAGSEADGQASAADSPAEESPADDTAADGSGSDEANVIDTFDDAFEQDGALRDVVENTDLDTLGDALTFALNASRYEVEGDTLHIHLSADSPGADIACVSAGALVEDRAQVVIHADGTTTPC